MRTLAPVPLVALSLLLAPCSPDRRGGPTEGSEGEGEEGEGEGEPREGEGEGGEGEGEGGEGEGEGGEGEGEGGEGEGEGGEGEGEGGEGEGEGEGEGGEGEGEGEGEGDGECEFVCNMDCECQKDENGCDRPLCVGACQAHTDCGGQDLPHDACVGDWACNLGQCMWVCQGEPGCEELEAEVARLQAELAACAGDEVCTASGNPLCGQVGGCYVFHPEGTDLAGLHAAERALRAVDCGPRVACACMPPPVAECEEGRCVGLF